MLLAGTHIPVVLIDPAAELPIEPDHRGPQDLGSAGERSAEVTVPLDSFAAHRSWRSANLSSSSGSSCRVRLCRCGSSGDPGSWAQSPCLAERLRGSAHWPASEPPIPPTLKYLFSAANKITGGNIITTATAITRPQFVEFCWKKLCKPTGTRS